MQTIQDALRHTQFYTDNDLYYLVKLHPKGIVAGASILAELSEPFSVLIADKDEVTLVLEKEAYEEYKERLLGHEVTHSEYRLITFDIALEPTLVGFMAHISAALAQAVIPIFPSAAFTRDHLLVPADQLDLAMQVLTDLKTNA